MAPAFEQSGVAHAVSYVRPMRLERLEERRFAVEGSPADCVLAGPARDPQGRPPDLVLSGVNRGHNLAEDTLYSGTVGGAMEGALHGMRSIALSQYYGPLASGGDPFARGARARGRRWCAGCSTAPPGRARPTRVFYNVNFPAVPAAAVHGAARHRAGPPRRRDLRGAAARRAERAHVPLADPRPRQRRQRAGLGRARVPRRPHHRDAADRRPDRARPDRAAGRGARIAEERAMDPAERQMQFVFSLRSRGVTNAEVLKAMEATPRIDFLEGIFRDRSFEDVPLPIACGQTISQPTVVGLMTQALEVDKRCKVLEIGTGSGYQAAILARLARRVYTIERHRRLARRARELFQKLGLHNITVVHGDGSLGLPEQAPFDRIIVTAAAEDAPQALIDQLRPGGIMVLPVGQSNARADADPDRQDRARARIHRPRRGALRAPCRRGGTGRIGLGEAQG